MLYLNVTDVCKVIGKNPFEKESLEDVRKSILLKEKKRKFEHISDDDKKKIINQSCTEQRIKDEYVELENKSKELFTKKKDLEHMKRQCELQITKNIDVQEMEKKKTKIQHDLTQTSKLEVLTTKKKDDLLDLNLKNICKPSIKIQNQSGFVEKVDELQKNVPISCKELIKTEIYTKRGIYGEKDILKQAEVDLCISMNKIERLKYYCFENKLKIGGKADASDENNTIYEFKKRQRRFFQDIPIYEKIQLEMYLWIYKVEFIMHGQMFDNEIRWIKYTSIPTLLDEIKEGLNDYICWAEKFIIT